MQRRGARASGGAARRWKGAAACAALAFAAALAAAALLPAHAAGVLRGRADGARSAARALAASDASFSAGAAPPGELLTWGVGGPQRLGRHGDTALPLPVGHGLEAVRFVALAAGGHTLGVSAEGDVWVWGRNSSDGGGGHGSAPVPDAGQLGHAVEGRPGAALRAADAGGAATAVASGRYHSAAAAGGKAWTWGLNDQGQLGRGATNAPHTGEEPCFAGATCRSGLASAVAGGGLESETVVAVAAGRYSTLAVTASGALYTWGLDGCAEGAPPAASTRHVPRRVSGGGLDKKVVAVSAGYVHWAALTSDGAVFTCATGDDGYAATLATPRAGNLDGELGRSGAGSPLLPGRVGGALATERVVSVAAGRAHTLAATASGAVFSWGNNQASQLGRDAGGATPAGEPARVSAVADPASLVAAGEYFSLAALRAGGLMGWGANGNGQLGRGGAAHEAEGGKGALAVGPAAGGAAPSRRIVALAAGYQHAAAIVVDAATAGGAKAGTAGGADPEDAPEGGGWTLVPAAGPLPVFPPRRTPAEIWAAHVPSARMSLIEAASPDVFSALPQPRGMLPGLASPCWRAGDVIAAAGAVGAPVRCLPAVHVLGVSKCGTTDLYKRLSRHPDFVQSTNKGPHFWDESVSASSGFEQYLALFDPLALRVGSAPPAAAAPLLSADASSNTLTAAGVWRRGHAPQGDVTVGELLYEAAPYTRCIVMLREPGSRWLSAFHYYRKLFGPPGAATAHDFHEHVTQSIATFEGCVQRNNGDDWPCIKAFEPQQLIKGLYSAFLWDWAPRFPREQLLLMRLEDYSGDMKRHLAATFGFLGMREPSDAEWGAILEAPRANTRADRGLLEAHEGHGDMMLPETREALSAFYAPYNEALAKALGDARFAWRT